MVNFLAVVVSAIAYIVIGMIWYNPKVFGKKWMKLAGWTVKDMKADSKKGLKKRYVIASINALVFSLILALMINFVQADSVIAGIIIGLLIWFGFIVTTQISGVLWERKPFKLYLINVGCFLVEIVAMSAILSAWV